MKQQAIISFVCRNHSPWHVRGPFHRETSRCIPGIVGLEALGPRFAIKKIWKGLLLVNKYQPRSRCGGASGTRVFTPSPSPPSPAPAPHPKGETLRPQGLRLRPPGHRWGCRTPCPALELQGRFAFPQCPLLPCPPGRVGHTERGPRETGGGLRCLNKFTEFKKGP